MRVAGFPELQLEDRCQVCKLVRSHQGLLKTLHRMHREHGYGELALWNRFKPIMDKHGLKCPSSRALGRHIAKHVDWDDAPELTGDYDLPDPEAARIERLADSELGMRETNAVDLALGTNDSDYHRMADLFRRLMRRIAALDADPTAFVNPDGKHSFQKLKTWAMMVSNAKSIIEGLNKMRNSDRMTVSILEQHTKRYATAIAQPLANLLRELHTELTNIQDPADARALATKLQRFEVTNIFTDAAARSLRESRQQFKLLN